MPVVGTEQVGAALESGSGSLASVILGETQERAENMQLHFL